MKSSWLAVVPLGVSAVIALSSVQGCSSNDEAPTGDAGADTATVEPDAGDPDTHVPTYCETLSPAPDLCADFDAELAPAGSDTVVDTGTSLGVDTAFAKSGTRSYKASVDGSTTATDAAPIPLQNALLRMSLSGAGDRLVLKFAYRPDAAPPASRTVTIAKVLLANDHVLSLDVASPTGARLREQQFDVSNLDVSTAVGSTPPAAAWSQVEIEVAVGAKTVTVKIDGASVASATLQGTIVGAFGANVGLSADVDAAYTVRFDDVILDLE